MPAPWNPELPNDRLPENELDPACTFRPLSLGLLARPAEPNRAEESEVLLKRDPEAAELLPRPLNDEELPTCELSMLDTARFAETADPEPRDVPAKELVAPREAVAGATADPRAALVEGAFVVLRAPLAPLEGAVALRAPLAPAEGLAPRFPA